MKQEKISQNARRRCNSLLCKYLKHYTTLKQCDNATREKKWKMSKIIMMEYAHFFLACMCISLNSSSPFKNKLMSFLKKS